MILAGVLAVLSQLAAGQSDSSAPQMLDAFEQVSPGRSPAREIRLFGAVVPGSATGGVIVRRVPAEVLFIR